MNYNCLQIHICLYINMNMYLILCYNLILQYFMFNRSGHYIKWNVSIDSRKLVLQLLTETEGCVSI